MVWCPKSLVAIKTCQMKIYLQAHPLSLMVQVGLPEGGSMAFQIFYIHQLEMVSVKAADPAQQQILSRLYPKDDGAELPSETAMQQAAASGVEFPTSRPDRPYV